MGGTVVVSVHISLIIVCAESDLKRIGFSIIVGMFIVLVSYIILVTLHVY